MQIYYSNLEIALKKKLKEPEKQEKHFFDKEYFCIYRNGGQEIDFCFSWKKDNTIIPSSNITNGAGIYFENKESIKKYVETYFEIIKNITLLGVWTLYETPERLKIYEENNIKLINATSEIIEPYFYFHKEEQILRNILKDKRILIISSQEKSIKEQIPKIDFIFAPFKIFENCTFLTIKPPVTISGNHENKDWTFHLDKFYKELNTLNGQFDVALIAAGGYGPHITYHVYHEMKKSSIYIGGALQLFFGVMGNRWRPWLTKEKFTYFPNEYWLDHPLPEDIPLNSHSVENNCYW